MKLPELKQYFSNINYEAVITCKNDNNLSEAETIEIIRRCDCHDDLLAACKKGIAPNVLQEYIYWLDDRIKAPNYAVYRQQLKGLRRILEIMLKQSDTQRQAVCKAENKH